MLKSNVLMKEKLDLEVKNTIEKVIRKNKNELESAFIKSIAPNYDFSTNGLFIFCGKMGSGKTLEIIRHILMCDKIKEESHYNLIAFCSTSSGLDKTVSSFLPQIKTAVAFIPDTHLLQFIKLHIKKKLKYYSLMKYINSKFKKPDEEFKRLTLKHSLNDKKKMFMYIIDKLTKYQQVKYPLNLLLVLDDFAGHPLLKANDSELCRIITKGRHYNITTIIAVQTTKFVLKNIKRMCTDLVLWKGCSEDDYIDLMRELPHTFNSKELWIDYSQLKDSHSRLEIHVYANNAKLVKEGIDDPKG